MNPKIIKEKISKEELRKIAKEGFGDIVKAVVDIEQEVMAVGGELHSDGEVMLIEQEESRRENTWGINIYPEKTEKECIEFDSMINIKPAHNNRSRDIEDKNIREKILQIVNKLIIH